MSFQFQVGEITKPLQQTSLWEIMKFSTPEWPQITIGCLTSLVMGAAMPVFAILFGEILGVTHQAVYN